jgi:hypothetical protein
MKHRKYAFCGASEGLTREHVFPSFLYEKNRDVPGAPSLRFFPRVGHDAADSGGFDFRVIHCHYPQHRAHPFEKSAKGWSIHLAGCINKVRVWATRPFVDSAVSTT